MAASVKSQRKVKSVQLAPLLLWTLLVPTPSSAEPSTGANGDAKQSRSEERKDAIHTVVGEEATGFASRAVGARGHMVNNSDTQLTGGAAANVRSVALLFGPVISARYLDNLWIGGDAQGVSYSLSSQLAIGARWELPGNQGPFARLELRGEMTRIGGWYYSSLRLPGAQVGWGLDNGPWILDLFGHVSPALTGRLRSATFWREVEGVFAGAGASLSWNNWYAHGDLSYLSARSTSASLLDIRGSLCSYWGEGTEKVSPEDKELRPRSRNYSFGLCADLGHLSFPDRPNLDGEQQFSAGLSIVFGHFGRLDRSGKL